MVGYFGAQTPISYLPEMPQNNWKSQKPAINTFELRGSGYKICADENGYVKVKTDDGDIIISGIFYFASQETGKEKWGLENINVHLSSDSTIVIEGEGLAETKINITMKVLKTEPKLDIIVTTSYNKKTQVDREALIVVFDIPVLEVYKKNRQVDINSFDSEYWLQKQGALFGNDNMAALVYNVPGVSSLQLDSKRNVLFVNLEYSKDHPHISIPFQEDNGGRWEDQSMASFNSGSERINSFSISLGNLPKKVPRIMSVPHGYLAGYVFTEHADGGNIRTHKAVYFGSDTIENVENATGGFVGNSIPVTKSIFYFNPESSTYSSLINDTENNQYGSFIDQLMKTGIYELCLHTPEGGNSKRELMEESIKFMKERYDAISWIDHGMFGGKNNRECFVADGLNIKSKYYAADLWNKYNTIYFWNPAVEELRKDSRISISGEMKALKLFSATVSFWRHYFSADELNEVNFMPAFLELVNRYSYKYESNSFNTYKGDAYPTPLYWMHPTRTGNFYSWATDFTYSYSGLWTNRAERQYFTELKQLDRLIKNQGIFINHGYYIRNIQGNDLTYERDGRFIINPYFEKILEYMDLRRDEGDLYISTIKDLIGYWILTENVSFKYKPDGKIVVWNDNEKPICGLSLIVQSSNVLVNGVIPKFRRIGDDTIFWFDINPNGHVILELQSK